MGNSLSTMWGCWDLGMRLCSGQGTDSPNGAGDRLRERERVELQAEGQRPRIRMGLRPEPAQVCDDGHRACSY